MRLEHCVTRNHIGVWNERVLPPLPERITFWPVLRGSFLPLLVWAGVTCFVYFVYDPVAASSGSNSQDLWIKPVAAQ
ncbi:hypothetical protein [Streptomyces xantholiticus]|uniref:hypothetical protein n=1 Tax=Streptomyces xantholiticus TaxID=68285 RepID=UPI00167A4600|nr:hypothetical protein [Streptomyces xantholiticus]